MALDQQKPIHAALGKLIRPLAKLSYAEVWKHPGMHLEKPWGLVDPEFGQPYYVPRPELGCLHEDLSGRFSILQAETNGEA